MSCPIAKDLLRCGIEDLRLATRRALFQPDCTTRCTLANPAAGSPKPRLRHTRIACSARRWGTAIRRIDVVFILTEGVRDTALLNQTERFAVTARRGYGFWRAVQRVHVAERFACLVAWVAFHQQALKEFLVPPPRAVRIFPTAHRRLKQIPGDHARAARSGVILGLLLLPLLLLLLLLRICHAH